MTVRKASVRDRRRRTGDPAAGQARMRRDLKEGDIELIVYDFDGVMTDNRVLLGENGRESVWVNRADGLGITMIREMGIPQLILSTETNSVVGARARKVKLPVIQGVRDKRFQLETYCRENKVKPAKTVYVGNDVNDLDAMRFVGFPVAPADANPSVLRAAAMVLKTRGGYGVIRELAERLNKTGR